MDPWMGRALVCFFAVMLCFLIFMVITLALGVWTQ